jgi:hypothetical protein
MMAVSARANEAQKTDCSGTLRTKEKRMSQVKIEKAVNFVTAKPLAWVIFGLWLALKHGWLGAAWCAMSLRERWRAWRSQGKPAVLNEELPPNGRVGRTIKRELARR